MMFDLMFQELLAGNDTNGKDSKISDNNSELAYQTGEVIYMNMTFFILL